MDVEELEFIDKSEWISPKEVKVYAESRQNLSKKMYNNGAIIPNKYGKPAIDRLYEDEGLLESKHRDAGISFKNLCDKAEGRMVAVDHSATAIEQTISPALRRAAVLFQLTENQIRIINVVVFEELKEADIRALYVIAARLQNAFDALYEALKTENVLTAVNFLQKKALAQRNECVNITSLTAP